MGFSNWFICDSVQGKPVRASDYTYIHHINPGEHFRRYGGGGFGTKNRSSRLLFNEAKKFEMSDWHKHMEDICVETTAARRNIENVINSVISPRKYSL